jgi:hypothetical protein
MSTTNTRAADDDDEVESSSWLRRKARGEKRQLQNKDTHKFCLGSHPHREAEEPSESEKEEEEEAVEPVEALEIRLRGLVQNTTWVAPAAVRSVECPVCHRRLRNLHAFSCHVATFECVQMPGDKKIMCERCAYVFNDSSALRKHRNRGTQCDANLLELSKRPDQGAETFKESRAIVKDQQDLNTLNRAEIRQVAKEKVSQFRSEL